MSSCRLEIHIHHIFLFRWEGFHSRQSCSYFTKQRLHTSVRKKRNGSISIVLWHSFPTHILTSYIYAFHINKSPPLYLNQKFHILSIAFSHVFNFHSLKNKPNYCIISLEERNIEVSTLIFWSFRRHPKKVVSILDLGHSLCIVPILSDVLEEKKHVLSLSLKHNHINSIQKHCNVIAINWTSLVILWHGRWDMLMFEHPSRRTLSLAQNCNINSTFR